MTVSGLQGPHDPHRLSAREEAILARIESDLVGEEPTIARSGTSPPAGPGLTSPISARDLGLLVVILLILVGAAMLLPPALLRAVLPGLTVLLVAPWTVMCVRRSTADR